MKRIMNDDITDWIRICRYTNVGTQCTDVPFGIIHIQAGGMERAQKINAIDNNVRKITLNHCCRLYD